MCDFADAKLLGRFLVMAGLVPAIPIGKVPPYNRDHRDKPGDDNEEG